MIKNILAVGDSFTYGEELDNTDRAYPYHLSRGLKANIVNLAKPGSGNSRMIRNVIEYTDKFPTDLVIIGWSSPGRKEFADADGVFDLWPGYSGALYRAGGQTWRLELLDYINKYHDPEYIYQQYLIDVIMMQSYLKQRGIKYIMLQTVMNEYYHRTFHAGMKLLADQIDGEHFVGWPSEGMMEWTNGCKRGPNGHFLDDGHKQVTKKLYEHVKNKGWL
jgi:hypothetical protein